jgi:hypothetical protein
MISRDNRAIKDNVIVHGSPDPDGRILLKTPALDWGGLDGM